MQISYYFIFLLISTVTKNKKLFRKKMAKEQENSVVKLSG